MNTAPGNDQQRKDRERESNPVRPPPAVGSEASQKGGKEPAQRQAERDWQNSPKESGE